MDHGRGPYRFEIQRIGGQQIAKITGAHFGGGDDFPPWNIEQERLWLRVQFDLRELALSAAEGMVLVLGGTVGGQNPHAPLVLFAARMRARGHPFRVVFESHELREFAEEIIAICKLQELILICSTVDAAVEELTRRTV